MGKETRYLRRHEFRKSLLLLSLHLCTLFRSQAQKWGQKTLTYHLLIVRAFLHTIQDRKVKKTARHLRAEAEIIVVRASVCEKSIIETV